METKTKFIKSLGFSVYCFLISLIFWYFLRNLFLWKEGSFFSSLVYVIISFSIFIIFSTVYLCLIDDRKIVTVSSFFITFSFLIFFLKKYGSWVSMPAIIGYMAVVLITFETFSLVNRNAVLERKNSILFHPGKAILSTVASLLVVFALLFAVAFYFNFPLKNKEGKIEINETILEKAATPFSDIIGNFIPVFDMNMTVDEFIVISSFMGMSFAKEGEEKEVKPLIDFDKPPEAIKNYLRGKGISNLEEVNLPEYLSKDEEFRKIFIEEIKKLASEVDPVIMEKNRENLSDNWGVEVTGDKRMGEVYTEFINNKINQAPKNIIDLVLIFPSLILFSLLEIIFFILRYIYSLLSWIVMILFYKAKFYHLRKVGVEKEELVL